MAGNANSGQGSGPLARTALLSLLEVHTEGATVTELGSYIERDPNTAKGHLRILQGQGKVHQTPDKLWHLTEPEAEARARLTPAVGPKFPLHPPRSRRR